MAAKSSAHAISGSVPGTPDTWLRDQRLSPPRQIVRLCERQYVIRLLTAARAGRVSLVIAPPGYGKTTVLAQWRRQLTAEGALVAWYTAAGDDREPTSFLRMIVRALHVGGMDMRGSGLLESGHTTLSAALDTIILNMERSAIPLVVIIDDFEKVESADINEVVSELIRLLPEHVHLVIASRRRPAIALSALQSQGAALFIGADELKLSSAEIEEVLGSQTPPDELLSVAEKTEGWPVVVQLYRLWRERSGGRAPVVPPDQLAGVAEYLTEQVFGGLTESIQNLIVDTSIFSAVEPALVDHVRERTDSGALLESLQELMPSLMQREPTRADVAYRLHPLVLDYARARLAALAGRKRVLHARAAEWFAEQRRFPEAVRHAVNSGERVLLAQLLGAISPLSTFLRDGAGELRALLREIPEPDLEQHPRLQIVASLIHFKAGFVAEADRELRLIKQATRGFTRDPAGAHDALHAEGLAVEIMYFAYLHRLDVTVMERKIATIRALASDAPLMWAWVENIRAVILQQRGDFDGVRAALDQCSAIYESHGLQFAGFELLTHEMLLALGRGKLKAVTEQINRALKIRRGAFSSDVPVLAMTRIVGAAAAYDRKPADSQVHTLLEAIETLSQGDCWFDQGAIAYPIVAELAFRRGGWPEVERHLDAARKRLAERGVGNMSLMFACLRVHYLARSRQSADAEAIARRELACHCETPEALAWRELDALCAAQVHLELARNEPSSAAQWAQRMLDCAIRDGRLRGQVLGLAYLAAIAWAAGEHDVARLRLREALLHAEEEGRVAPFLEAGEWLQPVLHAVAADAGLTQPQARFLEHVLRAVRAVDAGNAESEFLNKRELEILEHVSEGASNKLIARRLSISENTVKFHLKKIFQKLDVGSRRAAVRKWESMSREEGEAAQDPNDSRKS